MRGLFQFVPKKLEQDFSVFMGFFERFANFVPTPFFKLEQGFSRVHRLLGAFVPIVPVFNKSSIYKHLYRDPFPYSFFRALGLKIIGTNGTFTGNAHHYGKKYVPTPEQMEHSLGTPIITGKSTFQLRFCELEQLEQMEQFQRKTLINGHKIEFQNWNKPSIR